MPAASATPADPGTSEPPLSEAAGESFRASLPAQPGPPGYPGGSTSDGHATYVPLPPAPAVQRALSGTDGASKQYQHVPHPSKLGLGMPLSFSGPVTASEPAASNRPPHPAVQRSVAPVGSPRRSRHLSRHLQAPVQAPVQALVDPPVQPSHLSSHPSRHWIPRTIQPARPHLVRLNHRLRRLLTGPQPRCCRPLSQPLTMEAPPPRLRHIRRRPGRPAIQAGQTCRLFPGQRRRQVSRPAQPLTGTAPMPALNLPGNCPAPALPRPVFPRRVRRKRCGSPDRRGGHCDRTHRCCRRFRR